MLKNLTNIELFKCSTVRPFNQDNTDFSKQPKPLLQANFTPPRNYKYTIHNTFLLFLDYNIFNSNVNIYFKQKVLVYNKQGLLTQIIFLLCFSCCFFSRCFSFSLCCFCCGSCFCFCLFSCFFFSSLLSHSFL